MNHPVLDANPICNGTPISLPLYFFDLTPELRIKAKNELFENAECVESKLTEFRNLIGGTHSEYGNEDLMVFLRAAKHNVLRSYTMFQRHNAMFRNYEAIFKNFQFSLLQKPVQSNIVSFLPRRETDGCAVLIVTARNWDVSAFTMADILRATVVGLLDLLRCPITQITGLKIIVDFSGVNMTKLTALPSWTHKFVADGMQKTLPIRLKEYHVVNNGKLFHFFWAMFWPLLSKKLRQRVHFHGKDLKSLHKYISPFILPEEFEGLAGSQDNGEWSKNLKKSEDYIKAYINTARNYCQKRSE